MLLDNVAQATQSVAKCIEQLVGSRMIFVRLTQDLRGTPVRVDLLRDFTKAFLVLTQIRETDLEQPVEREIDHFVVKQLLPVVLCADAKVALRNGQQIVL